MQKDKINLSQEQNEDTSQRELLQKVRTHRTIDKYGIRVFFVVFFLIAVVAAIPVLRPSFSESENRNLERFPEFSGESLLSGEYFDKMNLWYSDTFPFRDNLVGFNSFLNGILARGEVEIHGGVEKGDEIPDIPPSADGDSLIAPDSPQNEPEEDPVEKLGAVMIVGNAAYEYYNFNQTVADTYAAFISRAAANLKGIAKVYDMIIPTSMGITAPKEYVSQVNSSDQENAINYMYSRMSSDVQKVDVYNTLKAHKKEYIYFRTDHHWTALGAYYAYGSLMSVIGGKTAPLSAFTERQFPGYLGSFYAASNKSPKLSATPDTVYAYEPKYNVMSVYYEDKSIDANSPIIMDGNNLSQSSKYLAFIRGDRPLCVLNNPQITDGSACVVVKESFGNALVPFLTENYGTVYVVDYRHFSKIDNRKLTQFVTDTGATDVIFLNNVSATRNASLVNAIGEFVG